MWQKISECTLKSISAKTEEFMFQNVAYRPTVYKTGVWKKLLNWFSQRSVKGCAFFNGNVPTDLRNYAEKISKQSSTETNSIFIERPVLQPI